MCKLIKSSIRQGECDDGPRRRFLISCDRNRYVLFSLVFIRTGNGGSDAGQDKCPKQFAVGFIEGPK
jgi:hypothetical protein